MTVPVQNLRSGVANKRPAASGLAFGQIAVNYNADDPAIYLRGDGNELVKVAPTYVSSGAPNAVPASGGASGNSLGETWLDISTTPPALKIWDGTQWSAAYALASGTTLESPILVNAALSGTTSAPTAASGDSSTSIATTAFVSTAVSGVAKLGTAQTFTATQTMSSGVAMSNSNVTTIRTATFNSQVNLVGTSGSIAIDWSAAQNYRQPEPTGTITYTFTAPPGPCHLQLFIDSDGISTAQTVNWPGTVSFLGSVWAGANNKKAVINLWYDGTNYFAIGTNQP
jgi:hypothetical protein